MFSSVYVQSTLIKKNCVRLPNFTDLSTTTGSRRKQFCLPESFQELKPQKLINIF